METESDWSAVAELENNNSSSSNLLIEQMGKINEKLNNLNAENDKLCKEMKAMKTEYTWLLCFVICAIFAVLLLDVTLFRKMQNDMDELQPVKLADNEQMTEYKIKEQQMHLLKISAQLEQMAAKMAEMDEEKCEVQDVLKIHKQKIQMAELETKLAKKQMAEMIELKAAELGSNFNGNLSVQMELMTDIVAEMDEKLQKQLHDWKNKAKSKEQQEKKAVDKKILANLETMAKHFEREMAVLEMHLESQPAAVQTKLGKFGQKMASFKKWTNSSFCLILISIFFFFMMFIQLTCDENPDKRTIGILIFFAFMFIIVLLFTLLVLSIEIDIAF